MILNISVRKSYIQRENIHWKHFVSLDGYFWIIHIVLEKDIDFLYNQKTKTIMKKLI
jgi:hypothetical protein